MEVRLVQPTENHAPAAARVRARQIERDPRRVMKEFPMKVRSSIKRRTRDCQIVVRKGKRLVINKKNPRLKQRQG